MAAKHLSKADRERGLAEVRKLKDRLKRRDFSDVPPVPPDEQVQQLAQRHDERRRRRDTDD